MPTTKCIVTEVPSPLTDYHRAGRPLSCEMDLQPFSCEFWPLSELVTYNAEYGVPKYAPGYFGFGTSGCTIGWISWALSREPNSGGPTLPLKFHATST